MSIEHEKSSGRSRGAGNITAGRVFGPAALKSVALTALALALGCAPPPADPAARPDVTQPLASDTAGETDTGASSSRMAPLPETDTRSEGSPKAEAPELVTTPADPHDLQPLECEAPAGYAVHWELDGRHTVVGPRVDGSLVHAGQQWTCVARRGSVVAAETVEVTPWGGNVLVVLLDDVGVDKVGVYDAHDQPARTPTLDGLAAEGMRFTRAYAHPVCSATRATALTGRHPSRTGIGWAIETGTWDHVELALEERTMAEVFADHGYGTAAFGKWHIATPDGPTGLTHPLEQGFQHFAGTIGNLDKPAITGPSPGTYNHWDKLENGELTPSREYATTALVDDTLEHLDGLEEPWFTWVAFHSGHDPYHKAPARLAGPSPGDTIPDQYDSMVTALDTELGRLLDGLDPEVRARTTVVVLGDNGTPGEATRAPTDPHRSKKTLFEGGVHVPMIVTGPMVQPGVSDALVHAVDLFALATDLVGEVRTDDVDAVSPLPALLDAGHPGLREHVWVEMFYPPGPGPYDWHDRAVIDGSYKLMHDNGAFTFHALKNGLDSDPLDLQHLTGGDLAAYHRLTTVFYDQGERMEE